MKNLIFLILIGGFGCSRPTRLSSDSKYNVVSQLNNSTWFATGKAIRLSDAAGNFGTSKQFNLQIITDINFIGNGSATRSPTVTGCVEDCIPTQRLHFYNIPLKKGKYKLSKLDKRRSIELEKTHYWLMIDGSGVFREYQFRGNNPSWVRVTQYDHKSNRIEGQFKIALADTTDRQLARFHDGLFRVKLVDVKLK